MTKSEILAELDSLRAKVEEMEELEIKREPEKGEIWADRSNTWLITHKHGNALRGLDLRTYEEADMVLGWTTLKRKYLGKHHEIYVKAEDVLEALQVEVDLGPTLFEAMKNGWWDGSRLALAKLSPVIADSFKQEDER